MLFYKSVAFFICCMPNEKTLGIFTIVGFFCNYYSLHISFQTDGVEMAAEKEKYECCHRTFHHLWQASLTVHLAHSHPLPHPHFWNLRLSIRPLHNTALSETGSVLPKTVKDSLYAPKQHHKQAHKWQKVFPGMTLLRQISFLHSFI